MVSALADTGAQSNLSEWKNFQEAGFGKNDLFPVQAANKVQINTLGAFRATVIGKSQKNEVVSYNSIIIVIDKVTKFFLLYETMVEFLIIIRDFQTIGSQLPHRHFKIVANMNNKEMSPKKGKRLFIGRLSP